jgi:hypothetical protein
MDVPAGAGRLPPSAMSLFRKDARVVHASVPSSKNRGYCDASRANTRKLGRSSGSSKNSGLTQPSASPFAS